MVQSVSSLKGLQVVPVAMNNETLLMQKPKNRIRNLTELLSRVTFYLQLLLFRQL